ncbi:MAG: hypothetical protein CMO74_13895 [Verrucomicrobiales bacterium]|nr:hypothetical protein [Verrucomicrobiales bacterium]|tara:strand:+ start:62689 stop:62985 length:297 start_codon:yes stop_codon:yes gene_type:complete
MTTNKDFCHDKDLVKSFNKLSKEEFLETYEYIDELEYNATRRKLNNNTKNMNEDYSISIPFSNEELEEMLHENKSFEWVFPTNENENVQITIHLYKEE